MNNLLTVKEACVHGKISVSRLYRLMLAGVIKAYKREGQTFIDKASLDEYSAQRIEPWTPEKARAAGGASRGTKKQRSKAAL